jgi:hypothetical protein
MYVKTSLLLLLLLCCIVHSLQAQKVVSGNISNNQKEPVSFAVVSLLKQADSSSVMNIFSDSAGHYELTADDLNAKFLRVSATGYVTASKVLAGEQEMDFTLEDNKQELDEVVVSSTKPLFERKVDRMIYNISSSITAAGGNGLDALKKAPGVMIQQKDYAINLAGKSGVLILVNDRQLQLSGEDLFAYLQGMSSDNIERIEVITAPPAKYDAAGNSGLINIVLKKNNKAGLNGNARLGYELATYGKGIAGADLNYRNGPLNVYGNISYTNGANEIEESLTTPYPEQKFWVTDDYKKTMKSLQYTLGADYELRKNGVIGIQWMSSNADRVDESLSTIRVFKIPVNTLDSTLITKGYGTRKNSNNVLNVNYAWNIDTTGKKLTLNVNRLWFNGERFNDFTTTHYLSYTRTVLSNPTRNEANGNQDIKITTAQADVELPYKFASLSFGGKLSFISNASDNHFGYLDQDGYHEDASISNSFTYREKVQALYISAQRTLGKWSFQAGLRGEFTQTEGYSLNLNQTNKNQYFNLFPTAYIQYQPNENNSWTLNYSKRINRPDYRSLDPFRAYATPYHYSQGNPFLQPSFNHNVEVAYTFKGRYSLSAFYQYERNHFASVWLIDEVNNITSGVSMNFADFYSYGVYASGLFQPYTCWEIQAQVGVQQQQLTSAIYTAAEQSYKIPSAYFGVNNSFIFNKAKTILAEINAYYTTKYREDFLEIDGLGSVDAGFRVLLFKKKINTGIALADIFRTQRAQGVHVVTGQTINNYFDNRNIRLTLNYKFGSNKVKARRERSIGIEDEKGRAG